MAYKKVNPKGSPPLGFVLLLLSERFCGIQLVTFPNAEGDKRTQTRPLHRHNSVTTQTVYRNSLNSQYIFVANFA